MTVQYNFVQTKLSVYRKGDHPLFGDSVTVVELDDEAGGIFFKIKQDPNDFGPGGELRFDFDEMEQLISAIKTLKFIANNIEEEMEKHK